MNFQHDCRFSSESSAVSCLENHGITGQGPGGCQLENSSHCYAYSEAEPWFKPMGFHKWGYLWGYPYLSSFFIGLLPSLTLSIWVRFGGRLVPPVTNLRLQMIPTKWHSTCIGPSDILFGILSYQSIRHIHILSYTGWWFGTYFIFP